MLQSDRAVVAPLPSGEGGAQRRVRGAEACTPLIRRFAAPSPDGRTTHHFTGALKSTSNENVIVFVLTLRDETFPATVPRSPFSGLKVKFGSSSKYEASNIPFACCSRICETLSTCVTQTTSPSTPSGKPLSISPILNPSGIGLSVRTTRRSSLR